MPARCNRRSTTAIRDPASQLDLAGRRLPGALHPGTALKASTHEFLSRLEDRLSASGKRSASLARRAQGNLYHFSESIFSRVLGGQRLFYDDLGFCQRQGLFILRLSRRLLLAVLRLGNFVA